MILAAYLAASAFGAALSPSQVGAPEPPAWWSAAVREETARAIASDLPATPQRFRFQCSVAEHHKSPWRYTDPKCISVDSDLIKNPDAFARRAREEAGRPVSTGEDRLRRVAWLRAMVLYAKAAPAADRQVSFVVDEAVGASDLPHLVPLAANATNAEVQFEIPPDPDYSKASLAAGAQGRIELSCRVKQQSLNCRSLEPRAFAELAYPDGGLLPEVQSYFLLFHDAQNAMQRARVSPRANDGRPTDELEITVPITFLIPQ